MELDGDLEAIHHKLKALQESGSDASLSDKEHKTLAESLQHAQHARSKNSTAQGGIARGLDDGTQTRSELDFFVICIGYALVAFALLATLHWSAENPLGETGTFGLAFVAGLTANAVRAWYLSGWTPQRASMTVIALAIVGLIGSLAALVAAGSIGAVAGIVLGAAFFGVAIKKPRRQTEAAGDSAG